MGQTVVEKITQAHLAAPLPGGRDPAAGDVVSIRPRHVLTHDNTAPVLAKFRALGVERVHDPDQPIFALDHDIQNDSRANREKYQAIEAFARDQGIVFYPAGSGIGHQLMVERGHVAPGDFVVASDSHANMYGALGALGTPVVRTDAAGIWACGEFWWQVPPSVQVVLEGALAPGVSGKDLIVHLCGLYPGGEVLGHALEFVGDGVDSLSPDARLTVANMTTEWGAVSGWFPAEGIAPDPDARYAARLRVDLSEVVPRVAGPDAVHVTQALAEVVDQEIGIHKAYLVSCVNARAEDLAAAAAVLEGGRVADGVELYVAAASRRVEEAARRDGTWQTLLDAGARPLPSGCGPCIGLGTGLLEPGEVGISATNRNFKGRMGSRDARCYLASPAVVAASARAGRIAAPEAWGPLPRHQPERRLEHLTHDAPPAAPAETRAGFPAELAGRLVLLPADHLDTDGIYGREHTYRDGADAGEMAAVAMANYDPAFARVTRPGDVLVAGWNFGTGSSREQAVTALQARGIALVIAASVSRTYLRNALNNGLIAVTSPELVAHLRTVHAADIEDGARTVVPGEQLRVDFRAARVWHGGRAFPIQPVGELAQELIVAGGLEAWIRSRLDALEARR